MRTTETNKANPKAPSQAANEIKKRTKKLSIPIPERTTLIIVYTLNIMHSRLNKVFKRCFCDLTNEYVPQIKFKINKK